MKCQKKKKQYSCIACIAIDSVMRENHPQVYLGECKYRIKKIQMSRFINTDIKSDSGSESEPDSEAESKSDTELMAKLKSYSDSEEVILLSIFGFQLF